MFLLKDVFSRFGFANTMSIISFVVSITCFAFVSRISQRYAKIELNKTDPKIIVTNDETIKITPDKQAEKDSVIYDNVVGNIDKMANSEDETNPIVRAKKAPVVRVETVKTIDNKPQKTIEKLPKDKSDTEIMNTIKNKVTNNKKILQLGIFRSHREAVAEWFTLSGQNSSLNSMRYSVVAKKGDNDQYIYLLQVKTKSYQEAKNLKESIEKDGIDSEIVE